MFYIFAFLVFVSTTIDTTICGRRCGFPKPPFYPDYGYPGPIFPNYGSPYRPYYYPIIYLPNGSVILPPFFTTTTAATTTRTTTRTTTTTLRTSTLFPLIDIRLGDGTQDGPYERKEPAEQTEPFEQVEPLEQIESLEEIAAFMNNEDSYPTVEIYEANSIDEYPREKRQINFASSPMPSMLPTTCGCYSSVLCPGNTDGTGLIDFRIVTGGMPTCTPGLQYCCPGNIPMPSYTCGTRFTPSVIYPLQPGQARYGDYPWMVAILTTDNQYVGGGVLIDTQNVLTTAHRIAQYPNGNGLKIRLGEWDKTGNYEQFPYRDYSISKLWLHELFNPSSLQNDIALIRLPEQVPITQPIGVVPVCMPTGGQSFEGQRCWVSGWGSDIFGTNGRYQNILKTVDVPIISSMSCENVLKTSRLGPGFILDTASFICAGGEPNKDACTGDGGSGLVCETSPGRWVLAGLVSWGLGCATPGIPGAYINVVNFLPWIQARQNIP